MAPAYAALLRALLRQPHLTSDALLITADALEHAPPEHAEDAARAAQIMRDLAPLYARVDLPAPPARALAPAEAAEFLVRRYAGEIAALRDGNAA